MMPLKAENFLWLVTEEEVREVPSIRATGHTIAHVEMEGPRDEEWVQPLEYESGPQLAASNELDSPTAQMA